MDLIQIVGLCELLRSLRRLMALGIRLCISSGG